MPECEYCSESFDDDTAYATHLEAEHYDQLGPIDKRRIGEGTDEGGSGLPFGLIAGAAMLLIAVVAVGAVVFLQSGGDTPAAAEGQQQPTNVGSVHYHGSIEMVVDGQQVDFSQREYQLQSDPFHFENGEGDRWHGHAEGVTLGYAMGTLGIEVTESTVTYQGTTYRDSDSGTSVTVTVNGDSVTPSEYVLQEGDDIRIIVE